MGFIEPLRKARLRNNRRQKDWAICHSFDEEEKAHVKDGETRKTPKAQEKGKLHNSQVSEEDGMTSVPDDVFHSTWLLPNRKRVKYKYAFVCKDCECRREKRCRKREPPEISSTPQDSQVREHFTISSPLCNTSKVFWQDPKNSECRDGDGDRLCRSQEEGHVSEANPSGVARATTGRMHCSREAQSLKIRHESPTSNISSETPRPLHCLSDRHRPVSRSATNDEDRHREETVPSGCQIDNGSDNCEASLHREAIVRRKERDFPDTSAVTVADRRLKTLIEHQLTRCTFPCVSPHMRSLEQNEATGGVGNTESENRWNNMNDHHIARNKFGRPTPSPGSALPRHTATDIPRLWVRPSSCSCSSKTKSPLFDEHNHTAITRRSISSRRSIEKVPCLSATTERRQPFPVEGQLRSLPSSTLPCTREIDVSKSWASSRPPTCASSTNSVMHYNERFRDSQYPKNRVFTTPVAIKTRGEYPSPRKVIPLTPTLSRHEQSGARRKESKNPSKLEKRTDRCLHQISTSSLSISSGKAICPQQQAKMLTVLRTQEDTDGVQSWAQELPPRKDASNAAGGCRFSWRHTVHSVHSGLCGNKQPRVIIVGCAVLAKIPLSACLRLVPAPHCHAILFRPVHLVAFVVVIRLQNNKPATAVGIHHDQHKIEIHVPVLLFKLPLARLL
ncbi:hypothetical protein TGDOM2_250940 [Toxoplasma gondii GAB2-2007-GAL-DOM2]|uniref:Uncharacterized protein n=4 Tax=Toxoplasma gondii TaxID=5811 RepID=A0A086JN94_TOXGO|nr:hypothetical protein TGRH88_064200 [Toxoplasma gondii]KFG33612.1 hypothetical protein TGFOU_250940 [Toxoplasma gondii FOU]KFG40756.1 hypothetical protein TGDOM2_250940 [Toxoplasma gondii GAB2-2007-GAL-DOM2]RQX70499.1 hypothetical protein TGCAST_250940 [Toxoplasma gondii CAST]